MLSEHALKFLSNAFNCLAINTPYSCQISVWVNNEKEEKDWRDEYNDGVL